MAPRKPTVLDLFCGAGGMSLGFHAEGARTIGAVDYDEVAARTFQSMFSGDAPVVRAGADGDLASMDLEAFAASLEEPPDLIVGGPPCQSFSRIGRAKQRRLLRDEATGLRIDDTDEDGEAWGDEWCDEDELPDAERRAQVTEAAQHGIRNHERLELYKYLLKLVTLTRPLAFVIENVPGMAEGGGIGVDYARRLAREAAAQGYQVRYFQPNAVHFGVPQFRRRFFFVGFKASLGARAIPRPPTPTHFAEVEGGDPALASDDPWFVPIEFPEDRGLLLPAVTVGEAIGDLPRLKAHLGDSPHKPCERILPLRREPSAYVRMLRAWPDFETEGPVSGNWYRWTPRDFPIFKQMAQGDRYPEALEIAYRFFQAELSRLRLDGRAPEPGTKSFEDLKGRFIPPYRNDAFHDKWKKLVMDEPSWTVTAHLSRDTYSHIHYDSRQARMITIREAARLQSFPDGFQLQGNFGEQFRQIGNAVPPLLARAIASQVLAQLRELGALEDTTLAAAS